MCSKKSPVIAQRLFWDSNKFQRYSILTVNLSFLDKADRFSLLKRSKLNSPIIPFCNLIDIPASFALQLLHFVDFPDLKS